MEESLQTLSSPKMDQIEDPDFICAYNKDGVQCEKHPLTHSAMCFEHSKLALSMAEKALFPPPPELVKEDITPLPIAEPIPEEPPKPKTKGPAWNEKQECIIV